MKPRQKSIITISAILLVIVSSLLIWYFYAGREYARLTLNNYLKTRLNSTLEIQSLSLNSNGLSITGVNLELTPQMTLTIDEVFIRISVFRLLSSGLEMSGSVKEISFISPVLHISKAPETASRSKEFLYHPYPLKPFSELKFIRRIIISDAGVSAGDENTMLADSISGRVDLMDISNVNLSMYGIINKIPNARIEVDGSLNLREGSFLLVTRAIIDDIKSWKIPEDNDKLRLGGGLVRVKIEARGADDLRISGIIETDSIAFSIGEQIQISNGFMRGELFGSSMGMQGSFAINSVTLPFTADIPDILKLKWTTEIASSGVDLSKLDNEISGLPKISGNIDLNSRFNGQGSDWHGLISVDGNNISVEEIKIDEFDLDAGMDSRRLRVNNLNAQVFGGELFLNGLLMFSDDGSEIEAFFNRNWIGDEAKSLFNADSLQLALNGRFKQVRGMWSGNGRGELLDRENSVLLSGALKMKNRKLTSHVTSPDEEGWLGLSLKREADSFRYQISTHNPHYALKRVLNKKYLPEFLHDYSLNFDLDGSGKQFKVDLRWEYEDGVRGGLYQSNIVRKANRWESKSNIRLLLDNGQTLMGRSEAEFGDNRLNLKNLVLSDEKDTQLLKAAFRYSDNESGVFETNILASNLPVAALIRFMKPDLATGCRSDLTTSIKGSNDSLDFNGRLSVGYPDGLKMTGIVNGDYINKLLTFDRFEIVNELEGKDIFTFEGEVDFAEDSLKSVVIRAVDFPIGRVLDLIQMDYSQEFDGRLNSRFELDGSMAHPDITSNVHVSGATIQRNAGYWMNIRSITKDSLYLFEQFDFGADVLKLIDVTGYVNRYDSSYDIRLDAEDVDISALIQALSGQPGPLTGKSNITMILKGGNSAGILKTDLIVSSGQITPILLNFDTLKSSFDITGFDRDFKLLTLNNLSLDLDDSQGELTGTVVLEKQGKIDVKGNLKGNLLGLLPRIDEFFSRTSGYGDFSCRIGGNISAPRVTQAQLQLRDGSMRLNRVVKRIEDLNVNITLDSTGLVKIHQFTGEGNGTPFTFANHRPSEVEQPIVIDSYDLGILGFQTGKAGVFAVIPSFMRKEWGGNIRVSGLNGKGYFEFQGPAEHPRGLGEIRLINTTFTFPFLESDVKPPMAVRALLDLLKRMRWDARLIPWQGCMYSREVSGLTGLTDIKGEFLDVDLKLYADLLIDDNPKGLHFTGSFNDTLAIRGQLTSTQGTVEYLDLSFDVDELGVIFNPVELQPIFYGNLSTQAFDSIGLPHQIRWVVRKKAVEFNRATGTTPSTMQDRGRWAEITLVFEDDEGNSQEQILALLGYSPEGIPGKLAGIGSRLVTDITPLRRWERDLERQVERWLGVDRVDITSTVASNIVERQLSRPERGIEGVVDNYSYLRTLDHSRVSVGKYLTKGVFVKYTGSLLSDTDISDVTRLGIVHDWDVMLRLYQIAPNLTLNYKYQYDSLSRDTDNRLSLRFVYIFSLNDLINISR